MVKISVYKEFQQLYNQIRTGQKQHSNRNLSPDLMLIFPEALRLESAAGRWSDPDLPIAQAN